MTRTSPNSDRIALGEGAILLLKTAGLTQDDFIDRIQKFIRVSNLEYLIKEDLYHSLVQNIPGLCNWNEINWQLLWKNSGFRKFYRVPASIFELYRQDVIHNGLWCDVIARVSPEQYTTTIIQQIQAARGNDSVIRDVLKPLKNRYTQSRLSKTATHNPIKASEATLPSKPITPGHDRCGTNLCIFISYSRRDEAFVKKLDEDLRQYGFIVWVDYHNLIPGTSDWESALRRGIATADAIILVATPDSRKSLSVKDELALARDNNKPVYPIWVAGDRWTDSIPLGWGQTQYADARGDKYRSGLRSIALSLQSLSRANNFQA